ncbi:MULTISPECIES: DUF3014 domain-containing protein [unclassified Hydrogenophaga]|uniref:DUF3014 domain-containing protein n=1 Tax=unclassified Hydrogenophaga TaxID=2610897 RepID=UPI0008784E2D|nr:MULTISPECIES: DUF3014 domain-containing protein [unclassified Hydrogenophaga]MBN9372564.1 DUF3014 domain-containing protein [Hydrogenophaga sp.]OJV63674.1 MAG: hypothetical protein BGO22_00755 [Hydrogenophaga sp. 70-12]
MTREPERDESSRLPIILAAAVALAAAGYFGWRYLQDRQTPAPVEPPVAVAPSAPPAPAEPAPAAPPTIQHPVEPPAAESSAPPAPLPALADADPYVSDHLAELLGRPNALRFLQLDGFIKRAVATVDNLGRSHAPVLMWPVTPTPGRFASTKAADGASETIAPDNSARYTPFVQFAESVDTGRAVALYRRLYPLFQQAYEELGFPGRYFNDRLVQVLDQLIATPVPAAPPAVALVQVKGEVPSTRPWVRYEYADPQLEALSAGQKILLRMGADNQRRLQAKLVDLRGRVARR